MRVLVALGVCVCVRLLAVYLIVISISTHIEIRTYIHTFIHVHVCMYSIWYLRICLSRRQKAFYHFQFVCKF